MLNDFGSEFVSILSITGLNADDAARAQEPDTYGLRIGALIDSLLRTPGKTLYFPPGRYVLEEHSKGWDYVCEKGVQLFFADNAILRIEKLVRLIIRGTIRAGVQQIFGFNRRERRLNIFGRGEYVLPTAFNTWPTEAEAGKVLIESDDIPFVRPEWWGALAFPTITQRGTIASRFSTVDSSDAFEGAIEAACTGRHDRAPIPIELSPGMYVCARPLEVQAPTRSDGTPIPVCLVMRGGNGIGGLPALVRIVDRANLPEPPVVLLRLHPNVGFDFEDVFLDLVPKIDGGPLEVLCDKTEVVPRRGLLRRVTLRGGLKFQLRIIETGRSKARRFFTLDSCQTLETQGELTRHPIETDVGPGVRLRVSNSRVLSEDEPLSTADGALSDDATYQASCFLTGGAAMLDSLMLDSNTGPRPSRVELALDQPDGQEVFLGAPVDPVRPATQLTMVQCEVQGWWVLSRHSRPSRAHPVVLIGVSHRNVGWGLTREDRDRAMDDGVAGNRARARRWGLTLPVAYDPADPPSVVWRGSVGSCLLIGCRLNASVVLSDPSKVVDLGTVFHNPAAGASRKLFLREEHIVGRRGGYDPMTIDLAMRGDTFDSVVDHLKPIRTQDP